MTQANEALQGEQKHQHGGADELRLNRFVRNNPHTFKRRYDPESVQVWLQGIEKIFRAMASINEHRVKLVTQMLIEEVGYWRKNTHYRLETAGVAMTFFLGKCAAITWEGFRDTELIHKLVLNVEITLLLIDICHLSTIASHTIVFILLDALLLSFTIAQSPSSSPKSSPFPSPAISPSANSPVASPPVPLNNVASSSPSSSNLPTSPLLVSFSSLVGAHVVTPLSISTPPFEAPSCNAIFLSKR